MDATILAGIMGLVGAIVGGALSFFGSIEGAKSNFKLQARHEEYLAAQKLYNGLIISQHQIGILMSLKDPINPKMLGKLICDQDWQKELALVQGLCGEEVRIIIDWYMVLERIENSSPNFQGNIDHDMFSGWFESKIERMPGVLNILENRVKELES